MLSTLLSYCFILLQCLLALRAMVGVGLGGGHVPVALYMEFVPTRLRGIMLVALQSFWTVGTVIEVLFQAIYSSTQAPLKHLDKRQLS